MIKGVQKIILFIISMCLGIFLIIQYQTTHNVLGSNILPNEKAMILNTEMLELSKEKNKLRDELELLKQDIRESQEVSLKKEIEFNELKEELERQKILSGYYDVMGTGAIITIDAEENSYVNLAYSHQYILALISYLNNAGAEAISINGQRYTNYTEVVPVLDHINVNGVAFVLPIEIKAIGNNRTIEASLNFVGGIVSQMQEIGFTIKTNYVDEVQINRYDKEIIFKHANVISTNSVD